MSAPPPLCARRVHSGRIPREQNGPVRNRQLINTHISDVRKHYAPHSVELHLKPARQRVQCQFVGHGERLAHQPFTRGAGDIHCRDVERRDPDPYRGATQTASSWRPDQNARNFSRELEQDRACCCGGINPFNPAEELVRAQVRQLDFLGRRGWGRGSIDDDFC